MKFPSVSLTLICSLLVSFHAQAGGTKSPQKEIDLALRFLAGKQQEVHKKWLEKLEDDADIDMKTAFGAESEE